MQLHFGIKLGTYIDWGEKACEAFECTCKSLAIGLASSEVGVILHSHDMHNFSVSTWHGTVSSKRACVIDCFHSISF